MPKRPHPETGAGGIELTADRSANYLDLGRRNQKMRTRDALVGVAAEMVRKGEPISVAEVADIAKVSRTTAYRYFPTSDMLAAQATLAAADVADTQKLNDIAAGPGEPAAKLDAIIAGSHAMTTSNQSAFRSMLRFTVETYSKGGEGVPRRPTFRRQWVEGALTPLESDLGPERFEQLTGLLCLLCGIEPIIVLNDICRMEPEEARDAKRWAAQKLLEAALTDAAVERATPKVKARKGS